LLSQYLHADSPQQCVGADRFAMQLHDSIAIMTGDIVTPVAKCKQQD
jgi:hypothetical protein